MWVIRAAAAAALAVSVLGTVPAVAGADPSAPAPDPAPAPGTPTAPGTPPAAAKTTIAADGTYAVGTDIAPGVYSTPGPVGNGTCFWKRIGNPDGATIDNALTKKSQIVQIDPTDKAFKTEGCQPWQLTNDAVPTPEVAPALAGLQLQAFMAQLNAKAAASGQVPPP